MAVRERRSLTSAWQRILVAGRAIFFYLGSLVWPFNLNFVYPRRAPDPRVWWQWLFLWAWQ